MADSLRLDLTVRSRESLLDDLEAATGEPTKARRVDTAMRAYAKLVGGTAVQPGPGVLDELLRTADEQGSLRAEEIAEILDIDELPLEFMPAEWDVGGES